MYQDFGARMEGVSYRPGNFYRVDHIGGANGNLWQLVNNGGTCNGGRVYSVSPPEVSSLDQYQAYNKELVRQTMLKQEAVFRAQVRELHRLYMRQRELVDEIKDREQSVDHLRKQSSQPCYSSSKMLPDVSQNPVQVPRWLLVNPRGSMPSALGPGNFQKLLDSTSERTLYRDSNIYLQKNGLREDRASSSKRRNCEKIILDLELPAEAYIHGEEVLLVQNPVEVPHISLEPCKRAAEPPNPGKNLNKESSYNANSSCLKPSYLLDLNESPQLGESETAKCDSFVEPHASIKGLMQKDLCGNFESISPLRDEDIYYGRPLSRNNCSFPCSAFTTLCPFPDEQKSEASNSVADQKTLLHNVLETSAVIQVLPSFNSPECLNESSRCSPTNFELKRKKPEGPSSMGSATTGINENGNCESVTEHHSSKRCKEPNAAKSSKGMDLNVTPSTCLTETAISGEYVSSIEGPNMFEDPTGKLSKLKSLPNSDSKLTGCPNIPGTSDSSQLSALTSSTVLVKSSEDEDVLNCRKPGVPCSSHSSDQSEMCSKKDSGIVPAIEEELALVQAAQTEVGSNLVLSVSPDDKEHSPLSGNPEGNVKEIPCQFSEQMVGYPDEDIEKISAETIISISQSGPPAFLKASRTIEPVETSSDCLDWFADIICSAASDPEIKFENLATPGGIDQSKYMTLKSTGAKVDDHLSAIKRRSNKRTAGSMLVKQRKARAKKARQIKEFKSEELQHVDSLSSCNMNENPQPSNVTRGRNFNSKNHVKRRCRSSAMSSPNRRMRKICSGADHFTDEKGLYCLLSYLCQWGKKNRRQKGRRARADNLPWCWQNLVPC